MIISAMWRFSHPSDHLEDRSQIADRRSQIADWGSWFGLFNHSPGWRDENLSGAKRRQSRQLESRFLRALSLIGRTTICNLRSTIQLEWSGRRDCLRPSQVGSRCSLILDRRYKRLPAFKPTPWVLHPAAKKASRWGGFLVGAAGFEPTASSSRTRRATRLRHAPTNRSCAGISYD